MGEYRLIILINIINKIMEKIIYNRIINATKKYGLLSDNQMENKRNKFIKITICIITKAIYAIWKNGDIASLL